MLKGNLFNVSSAEIQLSFCSRSITGLYIRNSTKTRRQKLSTQCICNFQIKNVPTIANEALGAGESYKIVKLC